MKKRKIVLPPTALIDGLGALLVIACVACFFWATFVHNGRTAGETDRLRRRIRAMRRDVAALTTAVGEQRARLTTHEARLAETGRLPDHAPVEAYFEALSAMAARHQLRVIRDHPLGPRHYPGLVEQRFLYEVTGATANLMRFLKDIESTSFWVDVSYLRIWSNEGAGNRAADKRKAVLTLSLFSAPPPEKNAGDAEDHPTGRGA